MKKLLLLFPLLLSLFLIRPASAVSDYTFTITQSTVGNSLICSNDSTDNVPLCSDYNYLKVESNVSNGSKVIQSRLTSSSTFYTLSEVSPTFTSQVFTLSSDTYKIRVGGGSSLPATYTITLTFSENPFSDCPDPEPCDCSTYCDEPFIVQLFKSGFWGVATGIVTIIVPILALFLVFRLIHDFLWGRG